MLTFRRTPPTSTLAVCRSTSTISSTLPGIARHMSAFLPRRCQRRIAADLAGGQLHLLYHELVTRLHLDVRRAAMTTGQRRLRPLGPLAASPAAEPDRDLHQPQTRN